jgi:hypothetical protein
MTIILHIAQVLFFLKGVSLMTEFSKERPVLTAIFLLDGMTYSVGALSSFRRESWIPLAIAFALPFVWSAVFWVVMFLRHRSEASPD